LCYDAIMAAKPPFVATPAILALVIAIGE